MARLVIVVDVDTDPTIEDPHEVAWDLFRDMDDGTLLPHGKLPHYAGCATAFVSAEWEA